MKSNRPANQAELILFLFVAASYFYAFTYKAFGYYFDIHDIHNLSWGHIQSPLQYLLDTFDISNTATIHTYRPVAAFFYKLCYEAFGINFHGYHLVAILLHLLNSCVLFILIRHILKHSFAALLGGIIFVFHAATIAEYWEFSAIFDLLCGTLMFLSLLFYVRATTYRSFSFLLSLMLFFLACRTKEMAFAQPIILLLYEMYVKPAAGFHRPQAQNRNTAVQLAKGLAPYFLIALFLGLPKLYAGLHIEREHAYAVEISSFNRNVDFYWNSLIQMPENSTIGRVVAILAGFVALLTQNKLLQFSYVSIYVALTPVLVLAHHREDFYLYVPLVFVSLYIAELYRSIEMALSNTQKVKMAYFYAFIAVLFSMYCIRNMEIKGALEEKYIKNGNEIRKFIRLFEPLHPGKKSLVLFDSAPDYFDEVVLTSAVHLMYHEWTIRTKIVEDCEKVDLPIEGSEVYCVSHRRQKVYRIPVQDSP